MKSLQELFNEMVRARTAYREYPLEPKTLEEDLTKRAAFVEFNRAAAEYENARNAAVDGREAAE